MFRDFREKRAQRIKGQVINIAQHQTYDMGGIPMTYYTYLVQLENLQQIILSDDVLNSRVVHLGLQVGSIVTVNGFGKLIY